MEGGHAELGAVSVDEVARRRGWSPGQAAGARRLIDSGNDRLGFKAFEETTVGEGEDAIAGEGWVHYLYEERIEEVEPLL
jgi:hypothetical protein